jgi:methyl-accepting chemotaxis protein
MCRHRRLSCIFQCRRRSGRKGEMMKMGSSLFFRTKLLLLLGLLLLLALGSVAVSLWSSSQAHYLTERSRMAHEVLETYLELAEYKERLFRQISASLMFPEQNGTEIQNTQNQIDKILTQLRKQTADEVAFVDADEQEEETAELERLAQIERRLTNVILVYQRVVQMKAEGDFERARARLRELFDQKIDKELDKLLGDAKADELLEVQKSDAEARQFSQTIQSLAWIETVIAGFLCLLVMAMIRRGLSRPLDQLMAGTHALTKGDFSYRINNESDDEFGVLAKSFDSMAG